MTLTELVPSTQYDVQVCRAVADSSRSDNCGGCLYCLMTSAAGRMCRGVEEREEGGGRREEEGGERRREGKEGKGGREGKRKRERRKFSSIRVL